METNGGNHFDISDGWWEIVIVLLVIVSVFGAALLTVQDCPVASHVAPDHPVVHLTRAPRPATPTPTRVATSPTIPDEPPSGFVFHTPSPLEGPRSNQPETPTPTALPCPTVVGWSQ